MPLSQASPDKLLPEPPENSGQGRASDAVKWRHRFSFISVKMLQTSGVILLMVTLVGLLVALFVSGRQVADLTVRVNSLDAVFRSGQMSQLTSNVSALEARLKTLEQQVSTLAVLPAAVQSASEEMSTLKTVVRQVSENSSSNNQRVSLLQTQVGALQHDVAQSQSALDEINRRAALAQKTAEAEKVSSASDAVKTQPVTTVKKSNRSARRAVTQVAPFMLTGIEHRGGVTFAVVIPRGEPQISAMRLLSVGDSLMGWTLRSTEEGHSARFLVNGTEQRVPVQ